MSDGRGQKIADFDAAEFLDNDAVIAAYLEESAHDPDPRLLLISIFDVIKAMWH